MLAFKSIRHSFESNGSSKNILADISWSCETGGSYAIIGDSGAGKSTLLQLMGGLISPSSGSIEYEGRPLVDFSEQEMLNFRRNVVGYIFQYPFLVNECNVVENVMLKALIAGIDYGQSLQEAMILLENVGLSDKAQMMPFVLSGGEQHRVAIARALMLNPKFVLLDEPTAHLDKRMKIRFINLMKELCEINSIGLVIVTHDDFVSAAFKELWVLKDGFLTKKR